jgi:16S rRNA (cytidine1402-2'-O)-methyltransferase
MIKGNLYLIPTFLSDTDFSTVFPEKNRDIIYSLDEFVVEELKSARRFLRKIGYSRSFEEVKFHLLNEHTPIEGLENYLNKPARGESMGLLSEAGTPCIADPGQQLVKLAHKLQIRVIPLVGPSSIYLALMASGFNGQNFAFHGYLPIPKRERENKLRELETNIGKLDQTQIFIETPYRNNQMFSAILSTCADDKILCVACNITGPDELIMTRSIREWKKIETDWNKKPAVFLLYHTL